MALPGLGVLIPFTFSHLPDMFSIFNLGGLIKSLLDGSTTNNIIADGIKALAPKFVPILENIGASMFPKLAPALHVVAGAVVSFDKDKTRWLQQGVNTLLPDEDDIAVDGVYGPATRAAVEKVQSNLGLTVDGFAGKITRLAIDAALNAIFSSQNKTQPAITSQVIDAAQSAPDATIDKSVSGAALLKPAVMDVAHSTTNGTPAARQGGRP